MEYSGFFNGDQEYGQEEFSRYFDNMYESGVSVNSDNKMSLEVSKDVSTLKVAIGFAVVKGFYLYNDSEKSITILADTNYDRIDRLVVRLNLSTSKVTIELKQGVVGLTIPIAPSLQWEDGIFELSLAQVKITTNGAITITDERADIKLCGAIRPKNLTGYDTMITGLETQFDTWFSNMQGKGLRGTYIQAAIPTSGIEGDIWIQTV